MTTNYNKWSKTPASNATADGTLWPELMNPSGVNDAARDNMAAAARYRDDTNGSLVSGGAAGSYTLTLNTTDVLALSDGMKFAFRPNHNSPGPSTINVNAIGAKAIVKGTGAALVSGDLLTGAIYVITYVLASDHFRLHSVSGTSAPLTLTLDDANNNLTSTVATLQHTTTGAPGNGIGAALDFSLETSANNNEIVAQIASVMSDGTLGSEDADLRFSTMAAGAAAAERARITSLGRVGINTGGDPVSIQGSPVQFQVAVDTNVAFGGSVLGYNNVSFATALALTKTRGATPSAHTVLQNNDGIGNLEFYGSDGVQYALGAYVGAAIDGAPGVSDLPTRLTFGTTADAAGSPTERMRINNVGGVSIGTTSALFGGAETRFTVSANANSVWHTRFATFGAHVDAPGQFFSKTRHASDPNGAGVVLDNDILLELGAYGHDGTGFVNAARIKIQVDGTPGTNDMPGRITFSTTADGDFGATERMRIDNAGRVNVGNAGAHVSIGAFNNMFEVSANTNATEGAALLGYGAGSLGFSLQFAKTRNASASGNTVVNNGDSLGMLEWRGNDGTGYIQAAAIMAHVDGAPGTNDMPARLSFFTTADAGSSSTERMRIDQAGRVNIGTVGAQFSLDGNSRAHIAETEATALWNLAITTNGDPGAITPAIAFGLSRHATLGSHTIVQSGDTLAELVFYGSDGSAYKRAADMLVQIDGTPSAGNDMPGRFVFKTSPDGSASPAERLRIDQAGRTNIGFGGAATDTVDGGINFKFSVAADGNNDYAARLHSYSANGAALFLTRTRNASPNGHTILNSGDNVGGLLFMGSDGVDLAYAAWIRVFVDGTPGSGDMPGRIQFSTTPDGAEVPVERMRIDSAGRISYNAGATLTIAAGVLAAPNGVVINVDTEAAGATDDLDTIGTTGVTAHTIIYVRAANEARTVVCKDGTGNLRLAGDFSLTSVDDVLTLMWSGTNWLELARADNTA